jgi:hypothetical protein
MITKISQLIRCFFFAKGKVFVIMGARPASARVAAGTAPEAPERVRLAVAW